MADAKRRVTGRVTAFASNRNNLLFVAVEQLICRGAAAFSSSRFPRVLATGSDCRRNATSMIQRRSRGLRRSESMPWPVAEIRGDAFHSTNMTKSRLLGAAILRQCGCGIPLPITGTCPTAPIWGAQAKPIDRDYYNHTFASAMVLHDMPQHENRVELYDRFKTRGDCPACELTTKSENALKMGLWFRPISRDSAALERRKSIACYPTALAATVPPAWTTRTGATIRYLSA